MLFLWKSGEMGQVSLYWALKKQTSTTMPRGPCLPRHEVPESLEEHHIPSVEIEEIPSLRITGLLAACPGQDKTLRIHSQSVPFTEFVDWFKQEPWIDPGVV